jgi:hypothetical protein
VSSVGRFFRRFLFCPVLCRSGRVSLRDQCDENNLRSSWVERTECTCLHDFVRSVLVSSLSRSTHKRVGRQQVLRLDATSDDRSSWLEVILLSMVPCATESSLLGERRSSDTRLRTSECGEPSRTFLTGDRVVCSAWLGASGASHVFWFDASILMVLSRCAFGSINALACRE